eukprot:TRINITY_DN5188_c0_g1_i1.p1 TRINITY_DN5188_c0_g1~~TRINITY_DN5188_c0_g1_i1.p1  ORF type:complete len:511 (+),score=127.40 TRINITY_DN5188_c0_g1_i1:81-1613(+)
MAATADETSSIRRDIRQLLAGTSTQDLKAISIGTLRERLEEKMGVSKGFLDSKKAQVSQLMQEELKRKVALDEEAAKKKRKAESGKDPAKKKEKKEKKEKDKKDKEEKASTAPPPAPSTPQDDARDPVDEVGWFELCDSAPGADDLPVPMAQAAIVATGAPTSAPAVPICSVVATHEAPVDVPAASPEVDEAPVTMGMSAFDDFGIAEMSASVSGRKAWAVSGAEDSQIRVWDLDTSTCVRILEGHTGPILAIEAHWDDMKAVSGAQDGARMWDLRRGMCERVLAADSPEGCLCLAPDWAGQRLLVGSGSGRMTVFATNTGDQVKSVMAHPRGVWALDADWSKHRRVASAGDESVKIWDVEELTMLQKIEGHPGGVMSISLMWTDQRALVGSADRSLQLWSLVAREAVELKGHDGPVAHLRADWKKHRALSGGWDAHLKLWNLVEETPVCIFSHECKFGRVRSLAADFEEMQAACGSSDGGVHIVALHSGAATRCLDGHSGAVTAVRAKF